MMSWSLCWQESLAQLSPQSPPLEYSDDDKFCQRLAYVAAVEDEWWRRWISTVLPTLLPARKWKREEANLMVGDVVMLTYPGNVKDDYVLARVIELFPDSKNLVRRVKVKYRRKNSKEDRKVCKSKMIEEIVAIQRLCLLEPVPRTDSSQVSSTPPTGTSALPPPASSSCPATLTESANTPACPRPVSSRTRSSTPASC